MSDHSVLHFFHYRCGFRMEWRAVGRGSICRKDHSLLAGGADHWSGASVLPVETDGCRLM